MRVQFTPDQKLQLSGPLLAHLKDWAEAAARAAQEAKLAAMPLELGGREGPEPVRFGDYEKKGIAVDF